MSEEEIKGECFNRLLQNEIYEFLLHGLTMACMSTLESKDRRRSGI